MSGYELRNAFFKGSSSAKDITVITNNTKQTASFEGFIAFLSFMVIMHNKGQIQTNFIILNSVSFFEKAHPFIEQYEVINLYLDNDKPDKIAAEMLCPSVKNITIKVSV